MSEEQENFYEDIYNDLASQIEPHIRYHNGGLSGCDHNSLCGSVIESFEYLLEFWLKNRNKENIEHP